MASANTTPTPLPTDQSSSAAATMTDDVASKAVNKRYEGLMVVRNKAISGKGAWYWEHLEPILIKNPDTNLSKAVKLRCSLCDAVLSASDHTRNASEHLKPGTCPAFTPGLRPPCRSRTKIPIPTYR